MSDKTEQLAAACQKILTGDQSKQQEATTSKYLTRSKAKQLPVDSNPVVKREPSPTDFSSPSSGDFEPGLRDAAIVPSTDSSASSPLSVPLPSAALPNTVTKNTMASSDTPDPQTIGTMSAGTAPHSAVPPLKVLPYKHSVRKFSGSDPNYPAVDFLVACEDAFLSTQATTPKEKIGFIRQQLAENSYASDMMSSSAFKLPYEDSDYELFRANFLSTFGLGKEDNLVRVVCASVEPIAAALGSKTVFTAEIVGTKVAEPTVRALRRGGWFDENKKLTESQFRSYVEFATYILSLAPAQRKVALSLTFGPKESIHDFAVKLNTKVEEQQGLSYYPSSVAAVRRSTPSTSESPTPSAPSTSSKPTSVCDYCSKPGHVVARCFRRAKAAKASAAGAKPKGTAKAAAPTPARPPASGKYCLLHDTTSHSTEQCFSLPKVKRSIAAQRVSSSGEAAQASTQAPR